MLLKIKITHAFEGLATQLPSDVENQITLYSETKFCN
jgi:hypothetical protein